MALKDEIRRGGADSWAGGIQALVATDAASASDPVYVTLPSFDADVRFGPCRWTPERSGRLPVRGDLALAMFDNNRELWIVNWWPYGS